MKLHLVPCTITGLLAITLLSACAPQSSSSSTSPGPAALAEQSPPAPPAEIVCNSCGTVRSITAVSEQGRTTGAGAVIGGIVGGVAGNQVGGGSGKKIATAAGVIGGALLGNNIEQNRSTETFYEVVIDMDNGGQQVITVPDPSGINPGSAVSVAGSTISLR